MRIIIGGDFVIRNRCLDRVAQGDYSFLESVRNLFEKSDYNIVNLEGPIQTDKTKPILKFGPNLQMPNQSLEVLKYMDVTNVTLANNHILDYGENALYSTIKKLKSNNIGTVGAGMTAIEAAAPMILEKGGIKVGILNYCENEFSIVSDNTGGANPLNNINIYKAIKRLKNDVDFIIIITHSGHENFHLPSVKMIEEYRYMIDLGADLVVNHHQHCVSGIEDYKGKKIYYGIGNLCFDDLKDKDSSWNEGMLVVVDINLESLTSSFIPYRWVENPFKLEFLPPNSELQREIEYYSSIIGKEEEYNRHLKEYYLEREKGIINSFEPYNNRVLNKLFRMNLLPSFLNKKKLLKILNLIECESHRVVTINAIKNRINNR